MTKFSKWLLLLNAIGEAAEKKEEEIAGANLPPSQVTALRGQANYAVSRSIRGTSAAPNLLGGLSRLHEKLVGYEVMAYVPTLLDQDVLQLHGDVGGHYRHLPWVRPDGDTNAANYLATCLRMVPVTTVSIGRRR